MTVTIDRAGRIVVPKEIRDRLALRGGEELEIEELPNGAIELRRTIRRDELVRNEHGLLAAPDGPGLGSGQLRDLIEAEREERMRRWG